MRIELLPDNSDSDWDRFVSNHPHGLVYYMQAYRRLLQDVTGGEAHYLAAMDGGTICGVLPLMYATSPSGRLLNGLPFFGSHGSPLAADESVRTRLVDVYNELARASDVISSTLIINPLDSQDWSSLASTHKDRRIGQWTPLETLAGDDPMRIFDSSARRNVNKAAASGITVTRDMGCMPELQRFHLSNIGAKAGNTKPDSFFESIRRNFVEGQTCDVYVARLDGAVIAALLLLYHADIVEYFTPGIDDEHKNLQAAPLMIFTAMREAARRGFKWWNWGGTWESQTGVYRFKSKWGAIDKPYEYFTQVNDESLLDWPVARFAQEFPWFFAVPYSALRQGLPPVELSPATVPAS